MNLWLSGRGGVILQFFLIINSAENVLSSSVQALPESHMDGCVLQCRRQGRNCGVFWVFEHPRNFWQKFDAQKCRFKFIIMGSGPQ